MKRLNLRADWNFVILQLTAGEHCASERFLYKCPRVKRARVGQINLRAPDANAFGAFSRAKTPLWKEAAFR